jgi:hypothetical protein
VSPLFLIALALVAWEILARRGPLGGLKLTLPRLAPAWLALAAPALIGAFAAQLALSDYQSAHDGIRSAWFAMTPYHFVDDAYRFGANHGWISYCALALALLQTAALIAILGVAATHSSNKAVRFILTLSTAALAALALTSPVVTSGDIFGYVGVGMMKWQAYLRPAHFFAGAYARVFDHYPIRPVPYGPVWLGLNMAVVALGSTFAGKALALRLFGAFLILALVAALRALRVSPAILWAVALNPMLWFQFVVNAHNDLLAIVLVVAALAAVERRAPWLAVALLAAAGAVKLPFLVLGVVIFARTPKLEWRLAYATAAVTLALGVSYLFGGAPYFDSLVSTGRSRLGWPLEITLLKMGVAAIALAATAAALFARRFVVFAAWFYPGLAPLLFPWYLAWSLPYVCAAGTGLLETLIVLPLASTFAETIYELDPILLAVGVGAVALVVLGLRDRRMRNGESLEQVAHADPDRRRLRAELSRHAPAYLPTPRRDGDVG